jgi:hypothetical protein
MINLEKIIFQKMDKNLKKEVEKDISKFELVLNDYQAIEIVKPYDKDIFILNCGYIHNFKFPEGSKNNEIKPEGTDKDYRNIKITFNYHNKQYVINGYI